MLDRVVVDGVLAVLAIELLDPPEQLRQHVGVRPHPVRRVDRLFLPLRPPPAVGKRTVPLDPVRGGEIHHLGLDRGGVDPWRPPELGAVEHERIDDHLPLQLSHRLQESRNVGTRQQRIEAERHEALNAALPDLIPDREPGGVAVLLTEVVVAELVGLGSVIAEPGLELGHEELGVIPPVIDRVRHQRRRRRRREMRVETALVWRRHLQVARENARHDRVVGRTLHVGVASECVDPATRTADVPQEELQDGRGPDDLATHGVHGPAHRVHDRAHPVGTTGGADDVGHLEELLLGAAGDLGHHVRRVAVVVLLQQLKDGARVLKRLVTPHIAIRSPLVAPRRLVVGAGRLLEAREQPVFEPKVAADNERSVGVGTDVVGMVEVVGQNVTDQPAQHRDVRPRADLHVLVGHRRCPRVSGIDGDKRGVVLVTRLDRPLEAAGMILGRVGPHHQYDIGVLDVLPVVGHRPATERGGQTGHRGAVSYASLMIDVGQPHSPHCLGYQVGVLIGHSSATNPSNTVATVNCSSLIVLLDKRCVASLFKLAREPVHCEIPVDLSPLAGPRLPVHRTLTQPWANR